MSDNTRKLKRSKNIFGFLSLIVTIGPVIGFVVYAICTGNVKESNQSYGFGMFGIIAASLAIISALGKLHWRSPIFIMLAGLYFVLESFLIPIIIIGSCTLLDETVFTPLHNNYKDRLKISKEIDNYER